MIFINSFVEDLDNVILDLKVRIVRLIKDCYMIEGYWLID